MSMGTVLHVPLVVTDQLASETSKLRSVHGYSLVATVLEPPAVALGDFERPDRLAVLFGCEGHGLSAEWIARCDDASRSQCAPERSRSISRSRPGSCCTR